MYELTVFLAVLDSAEENVTDLEISDIEWRRLRPLLMDWLYPQN